MSERQTTPSWLRSESSTLGTKHAFKQVSLSNDSKLEWGKSDGSADKLWRIQQVLERQSQFLDVVTAGDVERLHRFARRHEPPKLATSH